MARAVTVSAVVVTKDRPALLADALASVVAQTMGPLEVRIGDDGEIPAAAVVDAAGLLEVAVVAAGAGSAAGARNRAAAGARGDVLAFLDDDDVWRPEHLEGLARAFDDPGVGFAYADSEVVRERVDGSGARVALGRRTIARDWDLELMGRWDFVPPSALAVRRALFERLQGFDESFRFSEDWDFLMRAAAAAGPPRRVPRVTVEVRLREQGNASADRGPERRACLDRLAARHGLAPIAIATFWEVAEAVGA